MLRGKNAIITGTNRGIGFAVLQKFAQNGCNIWACARKKNEEFEKNIEVIADENKVWIKPVYFDLSSDDEIKRGFKAIFAEKKSIDVLVNNAGIAHDDIFQMTSIQKLKEVYQVNLFSSMILAQLALKVMMRAPFNDAVAQTRSIINIASIMGMGAYETGCIYGSAKAALISFTQSLATEVARYKVRVNAISPGITATDMTQVDCRQKGVNELISRSALRRAAKADEVADVALFLASENSSFVNGEVIRVDGGQC